MRGPGLIAVTALLFGIAATLLYAFRSDQAQMASTFSPSEVPTPPKAASNHMPTESRSLQSNVPELPEDVPTSAVSSATEGEVHGLLEENLHAVDSYRRRLDQLPSWLSVPESKKDALARLWLTCVLGMPQEIEQTAAGERWRERQKNAGQQIEELLGPDLYSRWKEYERTSQARSRLLAMNSKLGAEELHEDVIRLVANAMTEATTKVDDEFKAMYDISERTLDTVQSIDIAEKMNQRKNELMRSAARFYLTGAQLKIFDEVLSRQQRLYEADLAHAKARLMIQPAAQGQ